MIDMEAREIVDIEYTECERCGLLTHEDEMRHAYAFNGLESWGKLFTVSVFSVLRRVDTTRHEIK